MTALERIWAFCPDIFDNMSVWQDQPSPAGDSIEYIRVDLADAAVAAAIERAAELARHRWKNWASRGADCGVECDVTACEDIERGIRAFATAAQTSALEAVRVTERTETLRRVNAYCTDCETAAIVDDGGRCTSCGSGRTRSLREPANIKPTAQEDAP